MAEGWQPLGGVACYSDPAARSARYVRAMVREPAGQADPATAPDPAA